MKSNFGSRRKFQDQEKKVRRIPVSGFGVPTKKVTGNKKTAPEDLPKEVIEWLNHITGIQVQQ